MPSLKDMQVQIAPPPSADAPDERLMDTALMDRGGKRHAWIYVAIAILVIGAGFAGVIYRYAGGSSAPADVATVAPTAAKTAPTHDVAISPVWKDSCQGDLTLQSEQRQYYCKSLMPALQALSDDNDSLRAEVADLKERGPGGTSNAVWIAIGLLGALSLGGNIALWRRRKTS